LSEPGVLPFRFAVGNFEEPHFLVVR
jgi:hypothetical protein